MKKLRCESQADIFGKRDSHQWLVYMMVKWRLPCLENVINTLVWYNNTHISFAINYIALFLQSHPMWVARVPDFDNTTNLVSRGGNNTCYKQNGHKESRNEQCLAGRYHL